MNYRICWRNLTTGREDAGPAVYASYREARTIADWLNGQYRRIEHWAEHIDASHLASVPDDKED